MKILFIGAGNMAQAIINGIIKKDIIKADDIFIYEINQETKNKVKKDYKINIQDKIDSGIQNYDIIILSIKPQVFLSFFDDKVMNSIGSMVNEKQTVISIMAGISIEKLERFFIKKNPIIRIMPNTPALIGQSMSVIACSKIVSQNDLNIVKKIFEAIGKIEIMEEKYIDAVTALSGSGPAYVFSFIEAMIQGGILCGLNKTIAEKLAIQTVIGSAMMIDENNSPEELRHKVTSPGGTTIEGIASMEKNNFRSTIIEAIRSAYNRAKELNS